MSLEVSIWCIPLLLRPWTLIPQRRFVCCGHRFHSACGAGILRLATFARRMAPGNLRLPVEEVDALISGLDTATPATMFNPPAEQ